MKGKRGFSVGFTTRRLDLEYRFLLPHCADPCAYGLYVPERDVFLAPGITTRIRVLRAKTQKYKGTDGFLSRNIRYR